MDTSEKIESYFQEEHNYKKEIGLLRELVLKTELEETFKWSFPTYTLKNKNVLAICKFKQHFCIWFFNGVFLSDPKNLLQNAQEGKTKAMRQWKFTSMQEIDEMTVSAYIHEAIENQRKGLQLVSKKTKPKSAPLSELLKEELKNDVDLNQAFLALSPYKQKEYSEYISMAKQDKTKISRLEKIKPMILSGKGLNDKYR
jgi:uncharacterized protein YdeI (YjbR/CyaY-like superfamily)